ncbi:hypothetical protein NL108_012751 [Boleophthalmus pectinirostris]|nr:hypothetical protein NL108_012751 [Boleophthalmus pectinirostris]
MAHFKHDENKLACHVSATTRQPKVHFVLNDLYLDRQLDILSLSLSLSSPLLLSFLSLSCSTQPLSFSSSSPLLSLSSPSFLLCVRFTQPLSLSPPLSQSIAPLMSSCLSAPLNYSLLPPPLSFHPLCSTQPLSLLSFFLLSSLSSFPPDCPLH